MSPLVTAKEYFRRRTGTDLLTTAAFAQNCHRGRHALIGRSGRIEEGTYATLRVSRRQTCGRAPDKQHVKRIALVRPTMAVGEQIRAHCSSRVLGDQAEAEWPGGDVSIDGKERNDE